MRAGTRAIRNYSPPSPNGKPRSSSGVEGVQEIIARYSRLATMSILVDRVRARRTDRGHQTDARQSVRTPRDVGLGQTSARSELAIIGEVLAKGDRELRSSGRSSDASNHSGAGAAANQAGRLKA